jgi:drug/metabolite transporter (DMT)-like permease
MTKSFRNLLEIHISVILFGLAGLFGKFVHQPSVVIVFGRVFFATIALLFILRCYRQNVTLRSSRDYFWLALLGIILSIHWVTFFYSIQISSVAVGLLSFSTFPIFVTFIEPYIFQEKLKLKNIAIASITLLGAALIIPTFDLGNNVTRGVLWGVVSGLTFALLSIMNKKYVNKYSSFVIAFYQDGIATLVLLPFVIIQGPVFDSIDIALLILLGVLFTAVAHTLFIKGMTSIKAQLASIIASLEPVYGIIFATLILNELPTYRTIVGGVIILGATFYATIVSHTGALTA